MGRGFVTRQLPVTVEAEKGTVAARCQDERKNRLILQAKLQVGAAHDPLEAEADAVAEQVIRRLNATKDGQVVADQAAHLPAARANGRIRRMASGSGSPADGFVASAGVESEVSRQRGGGAPIEPRLRRRFEGAMGVDLSPVRIHQDDTADQLNRAVSAKAFTTGNDVFFSRGAYDPASAAGQRLLAHELTHTVQQSGTARRSTIQRMSVQGTDWSKTTSVKVFSGGGSGNVAQFSDGGEPIIVKVDQLIGHEVVAAGNLLSKANAVDGASGGYQVKAPDSRIASPAEVQAIKAATLQNLAPDADPRNFVTGLDSSNPVLVAEKMPGRSLKDIIEQDAHSKKGSFGKKKANTDSILFQIVKQAGPITALAKSGVYDAAMGMGDRFLSYWNAENFLYDEKNQTFNFVDNTQNGPGGFITTVKMLTGPAYTSQESFMDWSAKGYVTGLKDLPKLAQRTFEIFTGLGDVSGILADFPRKEQPEAFALLQAAIVSNKAKMIGWFQSGFEAGLTTLRGLLKDPLPLTAGLPSAVQLEVVQSLLAKGYFLNGLGAAAAWAAAGKQAAKLIAQAQPKSKPKPLPKRPATGGNVAIGQNRTTGSDSPSPRAMPQLPKTPVGRGKITMGSRGK